MSKTIRITMALVLMGITVIIIAFTSISPLKIWRISQKKDEGIICCKWLCHNEASQIAYYEGGKKRGYCRFHTTDTPPEHIRGSASENFILTAFALLVFLIGNPIVFLKGRGRLGYELLRTVTLYLVGVVVLLLSPFPF